ncbi:hypothetical protein NSND_50573 [Nitrospira sp. ND1]|nr:hypothetical protein NSND_50573 [Nitrospira sp. ND1]
MKKRRMSWTFSAVPVTLSVQERIEPIILRENRFARMFLSITRKQDRYLRVFSQQASKSLEYFESCLERAL